jgi:hypothetical protein
MKGLAAAASIDEDRTADVGVLKQPQLVVARGKVAYGATRTTR